MNHSMSINRIQTYRIISYLRLIFPLFYSCRAAVRPGGSISGEDWCSILWHQQVLAGCPQPQLPAAGTPSGHEEIPSAGPGRLYQTPHGPAQVSPAQSNTPPTKETGWLTYDFIPRPELVRPATTLYQHNLTGILETAVRATNAQFDNAEILKRLDVRLLEVMLFV